MTLAGLFRIQQVVVLDLPLRETVEGFALGYRFGEGRQQQRHRRQALLAVDDEERCLMRDLGEAALDINDGADEVDGDLVATAATHNVVPQLATFLLRP